MKPAPEPCSCRLSGSGEAEDDLLAPVSHSDFKPGTLESRYAPPGRREDGGRLPYRLPPARGAPRPGRNRGTGEVRYRQGQERTLQNGVKSILGLNPPAAWQEEGARPYKRRGPGGGTWAASEPLFALLHCCQFAFSQSLGIYGKRLQSSGCFRNFPSSSVCHGSARTR